MFKEAGEHIYNPELIQQSPWVARMDEIHRDELDKMIEARGGDDKVTWEDLQLISERATERLATEYEAAQHV